MNLVKINEMENNWDLIQEFLSNAGDSLETFRYYFKRGPVVLDDHIHTVLLYDHDKIIGYGHLDPCDTGKIWLGICLISGKTGMGLGKLIMGNLVDYADKNQISEIRLSVDIGNIPGKKLYEQFGFAVYNKSEKMYFMKRSKNV
jgi:ribosomal protein S18 acetylase RimI-like enzyme